MKKSNKQAFTLIELLVVVLIIGILAAVALPQYQVAVWKSRYANLKSLAASLAQAEEVYYLANGGYTPNLDALSIELPGITSSSISDNKSGQYTMDKALCELYFDEEDKRAYVECFILKGGGRFLSYSIAFAHDANYAGQRKCGALQSKDLGSVQQHVCKSETNKAIPDQEFSTGYGWIY